MTNPSPRWAGPACGLASAILYTLANIALRQCVDVNAYLVSAVKAAPTVAFLGPLIVWQTLRRSVTSSAPDLDASTQRIGWIGLARFVVAAFMAQFFGNVGFQKALEHIGLAASVPITLGALIVGGAVLGAVLLGEPVSRRKVLAMITLILAVIVLSLPDHPPAESVAVANGVAETVEDADRDPMSIVIGSAWAAFSGFTYSFFGVTLRQTMQRGARASILMLTSGLTGTVTLWSFCFATLGGQAIFATEPRQWSMMVAAGIFNFAAFVAITASLRLLPVVAVNLINASQVAMAAVAGVILFSEPITVQLGVGIALTLAGLMILARRTRASVLVTD